ncbi:hypothetical protein [uncultured Nostoc sp.]|uniref:hypothetical protein n=1 Tax=uncultured Nostoc sp. TaxID=340711 RepID=UPI0035C9A66F
MKLHILGGQDAHPTKVIYNQAVEQIANIVRREAYIMAYNDCFYVIGFALLLTGLALLFCKKVKATNAAAH